MRLARNCRSALADEKIEIAAAIGLVWKDRGDRYSELRGRTEAADGSGVRRVEMHYIGG